MGGPPADMSVPVVKATPTVQWLSVRPEGAIAFDRGIHLAIHRAPIQGSRVAEVRAAVDRSAQLAPRGVVSINVFRLVPEFPIDIDLADNQSELVALLRSIDRQFVACASIIEFGGVRGAVMRMVSRAVTTLARPRAAIRDFDTVTEGATWLRAYAERVGAPTDLGSYVRLYREVDRQLEILDTQRWARSKGA